MEAMIAIKSCEATNEGNEQEMRTAFIEKSGKKWREISDCAMSDDVPVGRRGNAEVVQFLG